MVHAHFESIAFGVGSRVIQQLQACIHRFFLLLNGVNWDPFVAHWQTGWWCFVEYGFFFQGARDHGLAGLRNNSPVLWVFSDLHWLSTFSWSDYAPSK